MGRWPGKGSWVRPSPTAPRVPFPLPVRDSYTPSHPNPCQQRGLASAWLRYGSASIPAPSSLPSPALQGSFPQPQQPHGMLLREARCPWENSSMGGCLRWGTGPPHCKPYTSPSAPAQCCPPSSPEPPVFPASRLGSIQPTRFFSWVFWCFSPFREIVCCSTFSAACRSIRAYTEQEIKHLKSSSCEGSASPPV